MTTIIFSIILILLIADLILGRIYKGGGWLHDYLKDFRMIPAVLVINYLAAVPLMDYIRTLNVG